MPKTLIITRFPYQSALGGEELHTMLVAEHLRSSGYEVLFWTSCPVLQKLANQAEFPVIKAKLAKSPTTKMAAISFGLSYVYYVLKALVYVLYFRFKHPKLSFYCLNLSDKLLIGPWMRIFGVPGLFLEHATIGRWLSRNPFLWLYKWSLKANKIKLVTVSKLMREEIQEQLNLQAECITNGVFLEPSLVQKTQGKPLQVLFVGRFSEDKGYPKVLELAKLHKNLSFLVAGGGKLDKLKTPTNVKKFGFLERSKLKQLYQNSDILILPATTVDPFGLVVAEAMTQGCPVLCSQLVGASRYLDSEFSCELSDFNTNFAKLVSKPQKLADMRKRAFVQAKQFDAQVMLKAYARLLKTL